MNSQKIFDREFLGIRARLLDVAAALDRVQRGQGPLPDSNKVQLIKGAISILNQEQDNRAEQIQILFSRAYNDRWASDMSI
jgi:hypothetical protein